MPRLRDMFTVTRDFPRFSFKITVSEAWCDEFSAWCDEFSAWCDEISAWCDEISAWCELTLGYLVEIVKGT